MKTLGIAFLVALAVAGSWALGTVLLGGHGPTNTTQHVPWGLWVALYAFLLGLSAGSFLLSTLVYVFGVRTLEPVGPLALLQAFGCLALGGLLIVADLGHPERMYRVLWNANPTSMMVWMALFYTVYIAIVLVELYLALRPRLVELAKTSGLHRLLALGSTAVDGASLARDRRWLLVLGLLGIPVAVCVHGGVGGIFAVAKARPGWFSGLFPIVFIVSALASGGALLTWLTAAFLRVPGERKLPLVQALARLTVGLLCLDLLLLFSEVLVTFYGNVPVEAAGWRLTLFGPFWWVFWFVQIGLGFVVPVVIVATPALRARSTALGAAGLLATLGIAGARLNLVIPPQIRPAFDGMSEAYAHVRWEIGYFPSTTELIVGLGVVAAGLLVFLVARRVLPLDEPGAHAPAGGDA